MADLWPARLSLAAFHLGANHSEKGAKPMLYKGFALIAEWAYTQIYGLAATGFSRFSQIRLKRMRPSQKSRLRHSPALRSYGGFPPL
jgi:hypothetical protein